jgi:hypothetical protein
LAQALALVCKKVICCVNAEDVFQYQAVLMITRVPSEPFMYTQYVKVGLSLNVV